MNEKDFKKVEKIVFLSSLVLVILGIIELTVGYTSNSIGLMADGIDSMSDSMVSFLVGAGIMISRKRPDKKFPFGYYRVETLASMAVSVIMLGMSAIIFYEAYHRLNAPVQVSYPLIGIITLVSAGSVSITMAYYKNKLATKYNLLSLKADARNSIKDGSASFVVLLGVILASLGFWWGDPAGAMVVGVYIVFVAITTMKEASLILVDAFNNTEIVNEISGIVVRHPRVLLKDTRLRIAGPYIVGELIIGVDKNMTVGNLFVIKEEIISDVKREIEDVKDIVISSEPMP